MTTRSATTAALESGARHDNNSPLTPSAIPSPSTSNRATSKRCRDKAESEDDKIHETRSVVKRRKGAEGAESSIDGAPLSA